MNMTFFVCFDVSNINLMKGKKEEQRKRGEEEEELQQGGGTGMRGVCGPVRGGT